MDQRYFKVFNPSSDVVTNPAKKYQQYFVPKNETVPLGTSSMNSNIVSGSYSGHQILNVVYGDSESAVYRSMQAMLRYDKSNIGVTDWIPVSSSAVNTAAKYATFISFNRNMYGDRLSITSVDKNDTFAFTMGGSTYVVSDAYQQSGTTYNIASSYTSIDSNFGIVKVGATIKGLFFGDLGLIMLYDTTSIAPGNMTQTHFLYQQTFHSKAYFCRITHDLFNATINRTWYTYSQDLGAYVALPDIDFTAATTIGLYNDSDELLAIAKLSQPIPKYIDSQINAKVVLEY